MLMSVALRSVSAYNIDQQVGSAPTSFVSIRLCITGNASSSLVTYRIDDFATHSRRRRFAMLLVLIFFATTDIPKENEAERRFEA